MITAAQWVRRGFAAPFPTKYDLDETEYERIAELAKLQLDDAEEDLREAQEENDGQKTKASDDDNEQMEVEGSKKSKKKTSSKSL
jgi:periodic tryptophan protein 1